MNFLEKSSSKKGYSKAISQREALLLVFFKSSYIYNEK